MNGGLRSGAAAWIGFATTLALSSAPALAGEGYRLAPGDVLQLTVVGLPDMRQKSTISPSGDVMLPLIGNIEAAGKTVIELSNAVKSRFTNKVIQQRGADGRVLSLVVATDEVTLDVAEYRPIYLRGDISKPGEQPFRPGMTVRQAVAVGGGYDIIRLRTGNPVQETAQIKGELAVLWTDVAKEDAIVWRLKSELGQNTQVDRNVYANAPLPKGLLDTAIKTESDQLQARRAERERELNYLDLVISQADRRLELLIAQQKNEEEASKQDIDDFERVTKLFEKGNVAVTRFSDARRAMLLSSTRILQTSAAVSQLEREREELKRQRAGLDDKRKIVALAELQEAQGRLAQAKLKVVSAQERLLYSSKMRNQLGTGADQKVELVVIRQTDKGREKFLAGEDTELWPGDAIEVAMDLTSLLTFPN